MSYDDSLLNKDILITYKDYMIKSLDFIEYWESKGVTMDAVLFLIRAVYRLLENCMIDESDDDHVHEHDIEEAHEALMKYQNCLNDLNAPVICIKLIWNTKI